MTCPRCECKHVIRLSPNQKWVRCRYCGKTYRQPQIETEEKPSPRPQKGGIINPFAPDELPPSPEKGEDLLDLLE